MSKSVILVTGASSGFGLMTAKALAEAGHTVYASMRETTGRNAPQVAAVATWAAESKSDLRTVELDVQSDASADGGITRIIADAGRLDVIVHNAGHMVFGPAEAFTPEQLIQQYDVNVLGTQRVNRAALPHLRRQRQGLLVWVGSSSTRGGTPPFLAPYFAAKAAMDALAVSYSTELALWGIETTIIVPGAFTKGTNHFAHSGKPADQARIAEYESGPYAGVAEKAMRGLASLEPAGSDPSEVARQIVRVVDLPFGARPFRVQVDPSQDGRGDRQRGRRSHAPRNVSQHRSGRPASPGGRCLSSPALPGDVRWESGLFSSAFEPFPRLAPLARPLRGDEWLHSIPTRKFQEQRSNDLIGSGSRCWKALPKKSTERLSLSAPLTWAYPEAVDKFMRSEVEAFFDEHIAARAAA